MVKDTYTDILKEASFVTMPGINNQEINFKNEKVYTNNSLKENVKKVASKYFSSVISSKINKLLDEGRLIPVFKSKNIIDYILKQRKTLKNHSLATTLNGKIYIFLDKFYSLLKLSSINEKLLGKVILHELIHVVDHEKPKEFLQINIKVFLEFYKEFFESYLLANNVNNVDIINTLKRIEASKKKKMFSFEPIYIPLFKSIEDKTSLNEDEYQNRYNKFIEYLDQFYESFVKRVDPTIWIAGQKAYLKIASGKNETLGQEFWNPAEILCILSEINPKNINVSKTISIL